MNTGEDVVITRANAGSSEVLNMISTVVENIAPSKAFRWSKLWTARRGREHTYVNRIPRTATGGGAPGGGQKYCNERVTQPRLDGFEQDESPFENPLGSGLEEKCPSRVSRWGLMNCGRLLWRRTIAYEIFEHARKFLEVAQRAPSRCLDRRLAGRVASELREKPTIQPACGRMHEAHLSAQQSASQENSRLSQADEHSGRPRSLEAPPAEGTEKAGCLTSRQGFTAADRIRKRSEYQRIYDQGRKISSRSFTLFLLENDLDRPRLGITVTRRIGGAVQRNRVKRLCREWFRKARVELPPVDIVINAKGGIHRQSLESLSRELDGRVRRFAEPEARS
jgi:ribonuclease P protein component